MGAFRGLCVLVVIAGCGFDPELVECGDLLCPRGDVCVADHLCATPEEQAACDGLANGTTCAVGAVVGVCDDGVCIAAGCGNHVVDPGEVCDDGNTDSGDGCRADCRKLEMCGDGVVDDGEGCDDGNDNAADGCDACMPTEWVATAVVGANQQATQLDLSGIRGIASDPLGNLYVAAEGSMLVYRIDPTGFVTVVAGTGSLGFGGDGGPGTAAQLAFPARVAVDALGNVFIADRSNLRVRRVDPTGTITTVAGGGTATGDGGLAIGAQLSPNGIAVDGFGNLYIVDPVAKKVREVDLNGVITTVIGGGTDTGENVPALTAQLSAPVNVELDPAGNLYVMDANVVRRVDRATRLIATVAGNGTAGFGGDGGDARLAQLSFPEAIAFDAAGNMLIDDHNNNRIRKVDGNGRISTIAGIALRGYNGDNIPATQAALNQPSGLALDPAGNLYISDRNNGRVRRIDTSGVITTVAGTGGRGYGGDGGAATSAPLSIPGGMSMDAQGRVYISETSPSQANGATRIRRVGTDGVISTVAGDGTPGSFGDGLPATMAELDQPRGTVEDSAGNLYIADMNNGRVRRVDTAGVITSVAGGGTGGDGGQATAAILAQPTRVAVDAAGALYIVETGTKKIRRVDPATGVITTVAGGGTGGDGGPATAALLFGPGGMAFAPSGDLVFADGAAVRAIDHTTGVISTIAGGGATTGDGGPATSAQLSGPDSVAFDAGGDLYITESTGQRVRRVDHATKSISTFAGQGFIDNTGDGGPATLAMFDKPTGLAIGPDGSVYVLDAANLRVRRIEPGGRILPFAGQIDPPESGPFAAARFSDPRAIAVAPSALFVASGSSGTVQAAHTQGQRVDVVTGRYPTTGATGALARFRASSFGTVTGVAYDAVGARMFVSETSANRVHSVSVVDAADPTTWTIAPLADAAGTPGFSDGDAANALLRAPSGLYFDAAANQLLFADTGNHVIRAIDLATGKLSTIAGTPEHRGFAGDGGPALAAKLDAPEALARCPNGDLFIADTGSNRVRRVAAGTAVITTVIGQGVPASAGEGRPAANFPIDTPRGLACDATGNLFVTSRTSIRLLPANATGVVDGTGPVTTIYGAPPRTSLPARLTSCLTGLAIIDATTLDVADSCTGLLVQLHRAPAM